MAIFEMTGTAPDAGIVSTGLLGHAFVVVVVGGKVVGGAVVGGSVVGANVVEVKEVLESSTAFEASIPRTDDVPQDIARNAPIPSVASPAKAVRAIRSRRVRRSPDIGL